jgi:short-subunit dehydrogenase
LDRKHGRILNVASVAAFYPGPYMSVYFATKAYVLHFSEALGYEIRGSGVTVTALCPGPTQSGFAKRAGLKADNFSGHNAPSADWVARAGYNGCMSGRQIVLPGLRNRLSVWAGRMVPRQIVTAYIGRILK